MINDEDLSKIVEQFTIQSEECGEVYTFCKHINLWKFLLQRINNVRNFIPVTIYYCHLYLSLPNIYVPVSAGEEKKHLCP